MARVRITDKDKGFKKLAASLGQMGSITLGVQGKEALEQHKDSDLTVGQIAAIHELGLGPNKQRSFVVSWMDANTKRMLSESASALKQVIAGNISRNNALIALGFNWTKGMRENVAAGNIRPSLASNNPRGAGAPPLYDTHQLHDAITYKVFLPNKKSIRDPVQRKAVK